MQGNSMPLGLEMALSQDEKAKNNFSNLTQTQQEKFITIAQNATSKSQMQEIVNRINSLQ